MALLGWVRVTLTRGRWAAYLAGFASVLVVVLTCLFSMQSQKQAPWHEALIESTDGKGANGLAVATADLQSTTTEFADPAAMINGGEGLTDVGSLAEPVLTWTAAAATTQLPEAPDVTNADTPTKDELTWAPAAAAMLGHTEAIRNDIIKTPFGFVVSSEEGLVEPDEGARTRIAEDELVKPDASQRTAEGELVQPDASQRIAKDELMQPGISQRIAQGDVMQPGTSQRIAEGDVVQPNASEMVAEEDAEQRDANQKLQEGEVWQAPQGRYPRGFRPAPASAKRQRAGSAQAQLATSMAARAPAKGFVLVALQRSGTHFIDEILNKHPCVAMCCELFLHSEGYWTRPSRHRAMRMLFRHAVRPQDKGDSQLMREAPAVFCDELNRCNRSQLSQKPLAIRGFDWKMNQGVDEDWSSWFLEFCRRRGIKLVWYSRRHSLRQHLSHVALRSTGVAVTHSAAAHTREKVELNIEEMLEALNRYVAINETMQRRITLARHVGVKTMAVFYEDVQSDPQRAHALFDFLLQDVPCSVRDALDLDHLEMKSKQMHKGSLRDLIENYKEVQGALKHTAFEHLLD